MRLDALGGLVTKAVSVQPRDGARAPRVAEFQGGMINAVGLANPGLDAVRREHLPWLADHLPSVRKIVNVVGFAVDEYPAVIAGIEESLARDGRAVDAYELNVSCPNTKAGGIEFGADPAALRAVVERSRRETMRPVFVKLSPTLANIGDAAQIAADGGADGISVVNTIPGLVIDVERRRPALGFGTGGVSGAAILLIEGFLNHYPNAHGSSFRGLLTRAKKNPRRQAPWAFYSRDGDSGRGTYFPPSSSHCFPNHSMHLAMFSTSSVPWPISYSMLKVIFFVSPPMSPALVWR